MKIIGSDFDGTLNRGGISKRDAAAVAEWQEKGNLFGIVTGRGGDFAVYAVEKLSIKSDFVVCGSGSMIYDKSGGLLLRFEMRAELCGELEEEAKKRGAPGWGRSEEGGLPCQFSTRFDTEQKAAEYTEYVNLNIPGISAYQNGICIDVVRRGLSKATGIAEIARLHNVANRDITAVGDSFNDLPMIEAYDGFAIKGSAVEGLAGHSCEDIAELCEIFG